MAAAMAIVLSGCGDSDTPTTEDTTPPAVTITGVSSTALATKDYVTITFTFSEAIDSATFTAATPTVTNGTKGSFTRTSTSVCTLQVAPNDGQGTMTIAVAVGAFKDVAGNANTVGASVSQSYDITPPKPSLPITFDSALVSYTFTGSVPATVVADPDTGNATNKVVKLSIPANAGGWPGATLELGTPVPAGTTALALKVYSPGPGHKVDVKLEGDPASANTGDVVAATTLVANKWETLVFRFDPLPAAQNKLTIIPHFETAGLAANNPAEDVLIDSINYPLDAPITFEDFATAEEYVPVGQRFPSDSGGPPSLAIVDDPHATGNRVLKITRKATEQVWAGFFFVPSQPIPADTTKISMRVWSTAPGINYNIKLEGDGDIATGDVKVATTQTNAWETLVWDYTANATCGQTCVSHLASAHTKLTVIPDHSDAASAIDADYYIDDIVIFAKSLPLDFESPVGIAGRFPTGPGVIPPKASRVPDPTNKTGNTVLAIQRSKTEANWGGVYFNLIAPIAANSKLSMKVLSPGPGIKFGLKIEGGTTNSGDFNVATTAAKDTWETLLFDYSTNPAYPFTHSTVSIIPDFDGDGAGNATDAVYYIDDIKVAP